MKFPIFASFILFVVWVTIEIARRNKKDSKLSEEFWNRESKANHVRKKPLTDLTFITIPYDTLPFFVMSDDPNVQECQQKIQELSDKKIVNLTGLTNTDLKLQYGASNLPALSEYDNNYTILVSTLFAWAQILYSNQYTQDAQTILEYAVSIKADISGVYKILCSIYSENEQPEKIKLLEETAGELHSILRTPILNYLKDFTKS